MVLISAGGDVEEFEELLVFGRRRLFKLHVPPPHVFFLKPAPDMMDVHFSFVIIRSFLISLEFSKRAIAR